ncbi:tetratricopeptide repeat protein [Actinocrispum wychmicini]|uniref:tetratricopeptide repeat protein n=1 Tax=Actinocrispum wychmicini TaxID=1213861 RepID=UPI0010474F39|nr:tetratricopeptide repeat protein [Actinocrispum wychmicini]
MGERRLLVIASQCAELNQLSFLPSAAQDMAASLLDPAVGGCVPAVGDGLLVDPTITEVDDAVTAAFERASADEATLIIALVGHGDYVSDDFYYLVRDTALPPSSRTAFLLAQRIRELLGLYSSVDGLVLLLDTCHAGIAAEQAAARWVHIVGQAGRRFEVLTASDDRVAANGCFSRQLARVLRSGHDRLGERLRCPDMKTVLAGLCPAQTAVHLAFDGRRQIAAGDEGLWLAVNNSPMWIDSVAAGNPASAAIERLARRFTPSPALAEVVGKLLMGTGYLAVVGPQRSELVAALARPAVAPETIPPKMLHGLLMLAATDTAEGIAAELARQLDKNVPGFAAAHASLRKSMDDNAWQAADAFERHVSGPLRSVSEAIRIAVDGVDGLPQPLRTRVLAHLESLLPSVQLVISCETAPPDAVAVASGPPLPDGVFGADGPGVEARSTGPEVEDPVWAVLAAAGGAIPIGVLVAASSLLGGLSTIPDVHDELVAHREKVDRGDPGTAAELVTYLPEATFSDRAAHDAIARVLASLAPIDQRDSGGPEQVYADQTEPAHLWRAGRQLEALASLWARGSVIPAEQCATWLEWSERVAFAEGARSEPAIIARARYATALGKLGNRTEALALFQKLLPIALAELAPGHEEIFSIRNNIGYLLFELERYEESRDVLEPLVADATAALSTRHPETLHARHMRAVLTGKLGNGDESARLSLEMLPDAEETLGSRHEVTTNARLNFVFWTRRQEAPPPLFFEQVRLLHQRVEELKYDDPWALDILFVLADGEADKLASLYERSVAVRGENHPETVKIGRALGR